MRNKRNGFGSIIFLLILAIIICSGVYLYFSPIFEKNSPKVSFSNVKFWNMKDILKLKLSDDSGIKYFKVTYKDEVNEVVLYDKVLIDPKKNMILDIKAPNFDMFFKGKKVTILVEAIDNSKWNFLEGNVISKEYTINIDRKKPSVNIISNSYAIRRGGSAIVIAEVKDQNLKDAYISFAGKQRFELIPFYKKNYFIAVIAWPVTIKDFSQVSLIAIDHANNVRKSKIPLYIRDLKIRDSDIKISSSFIKNVSTSVLETSSHTVPTSLEEIFVEQNRVLRNANVKTIEKISKKYMNRDLVKNVKIKRFKRLKNSATAAGFADRRHYYLDGEKIDQAWHLGMDWASYKKAPVRSTNEGRVIFSDYLGIYGNTVIIDHKLGIQTLYAHTSLINVSVGDHVNAGEQIANTGTSGAVLGDHLHFGVLIQGIEVNPLEWMDKTWIKTRIYDVIDEAKKVINNK